MNYITTSRTILAQLGMSMYTKSGSTHTRTVLQESDAVGIQLLKCRDGRKKWYEIGADTTMKWYDDNQKKLCDNIISAIGLETYKGSRVWKIKNRVLAEQKYLLILLSN